MCVRGALVSDLFRYCMHTAHGLIKLYCLIVLDFAKNTISYAYGAFRLDVGLVCCNCIAIRRPSGREVDWPLEMQDYI